VSQEISFSAQFFRSRFWFVSGLTNAFDALNNEQTALSIRSASVLPGTLGAGTGFMWSHHTADSAAWSWRGYGNFSIRCRECGLSDIPSLYPSLK
jgi:hypothetical protein